MQNVALEFPGEKTKYQVVIGLGLLSDLPAAIEAAAPGLLKAKSKVALFGDEALFSLYEANILPPFEKKEIKVITASFPASETSKSLATIASFYSQLTKERVERRTPILAFGGGIAGDVVGFVAASYLRGLPFVQIPTTLLAMVDASVGGKVGVNLPEGKNLVGAFHQPRAVLIDVEVLRTLPEREYRAGLAECVKHAIIRDEALFHWTSEHISQILAKNPAVLQELILKNVSIKAGIVMRDEKEQGERALLNFGHTFAHAIESETKYSQFLHGEAVSLGMVAATELSILLGRAPTELRTTIETLLTACGLPIRAKLPPADALMQAMTLDKKVQDSAIRFILPLSIGSAEIQKGAPAELLKKAWNSISQ